mmetsp:Transcript_119949/g.344747  ORF Transcript_119949/g.344747 Transcript_119949/m.344747 type:complete len:285 (+) Transcript_119949:559-1413(+)
MRCQWTSLSIDALDGHDSGCIAICVVHLQDDTGLQRHILARLEHLIAHEIAPFEEGVRAGTAITSYKQVSTPESAIAQGDALPVEGERGVLFILGSRPSELDGTLMQQSVSLRVPNPHLCQGTLQARVCDNCDFVPFGREQALLMFSGCRFRRIQPASQAGLEMSKHVEIDRGTPMLKDHLAVARHRYDFVERVFGRATDVEHLVEAISADVAEIAQGRDKQLFDVEPTDWLEATSSRTDNIGGPRHDMRALVRLKQKRPDLDHNQADPVFRRECRQRTGCRNE